MSFVIAHIDNQLEDGLFYRYQLCKDNDGTYFVWRGTGPLSGFKECENIESLQEAFEELYEIMKHNEEWN